MHMISSHPRWNSEYRLSGAPLIMSFAVAGSSRESSIRMTIPDVVCLFVCMCVFVFV